MPIIKNKLNQRLEIDLSDGKSIQLLSGGQATIDDSDLSFPNLRNYLSKGEVVVLSPGVEKKDVVHMTEIIKEEVSTKEEKHII